MAKTLSEETMNQRTAREIVGGVIGAGVRAVYGGEWTALEGQRVQAAIANAMARELDIRDADVSRLTQELSAERERAERLAAQVAAWKTYDDDSHDEKPWGMGCRRDCTKCAALRAARAINDQSEPPSTHTETKPLNPTTDAGEKAGE